MKKIKELLKELPLQFTICFIILVFLLFFAISNTHAATISSFSVNNNGTSSYYDIVKYQSTDMLKIQTYGSMNTNYSVSYVQHQYNFKSTINSNYYDLIINFTNSNFKASAIQDVKIVGYNSKPTNNEYNSNLGSTLNLVYVKNNNSSDSTNSITIRFLNQLASSFSYFQVFVKLDYRVMNTGLSSFDLESIDSDQAIKDLQENQNTNRDLIINNITNSIDNSLNNCFENVIPTGNYISSTGEVIINGTYDSTNWLKLGTLTLNPGNYTLMANTGNSGISLIIDELRQYDTSSIEQFTLTSSLTINLYIRVDSGTYDNVKFFPGLLTGFTNTYVKPGEKTCTSKIDDLNDNIKDTNDKINDLDNNITDSDTSGANSKGKSFFDNFNTTDNGGISSIVSAPLRLIKGLVSSNGTNSCTDLPMNIMGKDVFLPCGKILWSKVPQGTLTIYYTIICGVGAYALLRALFKDIENLKNPNNSEVKTTDL